MTGIETEYRRLHGGSAERYARAVSVFPNGVTHDGRFVDADSLLVSIAPWQYGMLANKGKIRQGNHKADDPLERVTIATTMYDDELGLLFDA